MVFLGMEFSHEGSRIDPKRYNKIAELRAPQNVKQVRMLIGFLTYYRRYIRNFSIIAEPIRRLLQKDIPFEWSEPQETALQHLKQDLLSNLLLTYHSMIRLKV